MSKLRVLVLCGGKSAEHQVSLVSAKQVCSYLDPEKYSAEIVYIDPAGQWLQAEPKRLTGKMGNSKTLVPTRSKALHPAERLKPSGRPVDVVFPVLHGPMGEDGTVQGMLELAGIPYVGCGVLASSVGMDKEVTKRLALQAALPILPYLIVRHPDEAAGATHTLGLPVFVKPSRLGSSVGVSKAHSLSELAKALKRASLYDDKVILEKGIAAREIECALLGDPWSHDPNDRLRLQASPCGEVVPLDEFYTYRAKYLDPRGAQLKIPAEIPSETADRVRELALAAFQAIDGYGMGRADFLLDKSSGKIYFSEVNTIPGFTAASLYPLLWKAAGVDLTELLDRLIQLALRRHRAKSKLKTKP